MTMWGGGGAGEPSADAGAIRYRFSPTRRLSTSKLKSKAKATWTFHGDAGAGYSWQPDGAVWDGELFAMAVMPSFQNITTLRTNNAGEDLRLQTRISSQTGGRRTQPICRSRAARSAVIMTNGHCSNRLLPHIDQQPVEIRTRRVKGQHRLFIQPRHSRCLEHHHLLS